MQGRILQGYDAALLSRAEFFRDMMQHHYPGQNSPGI